MSKKYKPDGKIKITITAEIFGAFAVHERADQAGEMWRVTHVKSGLQLPAPWQFTEIEDARSLAVELSEQFPNVNAESHEELFTLQAHCHKFLIALVEKGNVKL